MLAILILALQALMDSDYKKSIIAYCVIELLFMLLFHVSIVGVIVSDVIFAILSIIVFAIRSSFLKWIFVIVAASLLFVH